MSEYEYRVQDSLNDTILPGECADVRELNSSDCLMQGRIMQEPGLAIITRHYVCIYDDLHWDSALHTLHQLIALY